MAYPVVNVVGGQDGCHKDSMLSFISFQNFKELGLNCKGKNMIKRSLSYYWIPIYLHTSRKRIDEDRKESSERFACAVVRCASSHNRGEIRRLLQRLDTPQ